RASGKVYRGPLHKLGPDWAVEVGKGVRHKVAGADLLLIRREGVHLPPLPTDEHLVLVNGDRVPARDLRLDDEKLFFRHPDLDGGKETSLPLASVVLFWRLPPDRTPVPERLRRRLASGPRKTDRVLLRNGDSLAGTLNKLDPRSLEVEVDRKVVTVKTPQVSAITLSAELAERPRPK